jgi:8-oxo-dGTP diphosphatase
MPAALGIVFSGEEPNQILLIKRRDIPVWVLPGGGIDKGEVPEHACLREVLEESGLEVTIERKLGFYKPKNWLSDYTHIFVCKPKSGSLTTGPETKDIRYFSINALPKMMPPPHRMWAQRAYAGCKNEEAHVPDATSSLFFKALLTHPILILRFILARIGIHINT